MTADLLPCPSECADDTGWWAVADPETVWRVCHMRRGIDGSGQKKGCERCPASEDRGDGSYTRGCYLQAVELVNVVETGNPWRKTSDVKPPWTADLLPCPSEVDEPPVAPGMRRLLLWSIWIDEADAENQNIGNRATCGEGASFADVYRAFGLIRKEVDRQIEQRRDCPMNPKYGDGLEQFERGDAALSALSSEPGAGGGIEGASGADSADARVCDTAEDGQRKSEGDPA